MSKLKTHSSNGGGRFSQPSAKKITGNISGFTTDEPRLLKMGQEELTEQYDEMYDEMLQQQEVIAAGDAGLPRPLIPIPVTLKSLRNGCYFAHYYPAASIPVILRGYYQGTIRIEKTTSYTKASGDLYYARPVSVFPAIRGSSSPSPSNGIPIFSRGSYTYYLKVTKVLQGFTFTGSFQLEFEMHRYNQTTKSFSLEKNVKAKMLWTTAPAGYPDAGQFLKGEVKDSSGNIIGTLLMGWVDKYLRKATIEIDNVSGSEIPLDSGTGENWHTAANKVGWRLKIIPSNNNIAEPSGDSWSDAELHQQMLLHRDTSDLNTEWRYHILCVKRLDSTERGIMYDAYGTDSNNVPREGMGISSHWVIPNTPDWGLVRGMRFGTAKAPYFRTAVHEIGHAMGLYHNSNNNGFMNTTPQIVANATATNPFPNNIIWNYEPEDQKRLRHFPDIVVRPGGTPFGISYGSIPIPLDAGDEAEMNMVQDGLFDELLQLEVKPVLNVFPLGAPVRLDFSISNIGKTEMDVPRELSMKKASVHGFVTDPGGNRRSFSPLILCLDDETTVALQPGKKNSDSVTLLRGKEGALFQQAGYHQIELCVDWNVNDVPVSVKGNCSVMITPAVDDEHAEVAKAIFDNADVHLVLALGGDHLVDAVEVIQLALGNKVLRPHYAYIEAKRLGKTFGKRKAQKDKVKALLQKDVILNAKEKQKATDLLN
jgi:Matrixin